MERRKRGYNRVVSKQRDYRLFAIACEGSVRERDYFECFEVLSSRISVDLIADVDENGNVVVSRNSSPEHVLRRAQEYAENTDLIDGDQMWIVIDVDRWPEEQLSILAQECYAKGWNLAISNPCFEVWLCYHMEKDIPDGGEEKDSAYFKVHLSQLTAEGYTPEVYSPLAFNAAEVAKIKDLNPALRIPPYKVTRVYRLMEQMRNFSSVSELESFINSAKFGRLSRKRRW